MSDKDERVWIAQKLASGTASHAEGSSGRATGDMAHAEGANTTASAAGGAAGGAAAFILMSVLPKLRKKDED